MCAQDCRVFLWGGSGTPSYDLNGQCHCICDDQAWLDHNITGNPSCVPVKAHLVFGWIGLLLNVAALCHTGYHLRLQRQFHAQQVVAETSPIEHCRRNMHIGIISAAAFGVCYFSLVLFDELRLATEVLGVMMVPSSCGAIFGQRMWAYMIDRRLASASREITAITSWLESLRGCVISCVGVSILPVAGTILVLVDRTRTVVAIKMMAMDVSLLCVVGLIVFVSCGRSLVRVIDAAMQQQRPEYESGSGQDANWGGDEFLLGARRKARRVVFFFAQQFVMVISLLTFATFSKYGSAAPLLLFGIPLAAVPALWQIVGTQLFSGRTKLSYTTLRFRGQLRLASGFTRRLSRRASSLFLMMHQNDQLVVPIVDSPRVPLT